MSSKLTPWGEMPYQQLTKQQSFRTNITCDSRDIGLLISICPTHGFLTYLIQSQIKSLALYARQHSLTYGDADQLIAYVRSTSLCHGAVAQSVAEDGDRHERDRVETVCSDVKNSQDQSTNLQQAPQSRRDKIRRAAERVKGKKVSGSGESGQS
jgi:hypothetical protein